MSNPKNTPAKQPEKAPEKVTRAEPKVVHPDGWEKFARDAGNGTIIYNFDER